MSNWKYDFIPITSYIHISPPPPCSSYKKMLSTSLTVCILRIQPAQLYYRKFNSFVAWKCEIPPKRFCFVLFLQVEFVDMHYGSKSDPMKNPFLFAEHLEEIRNCRAVSRGCFFMVFNKILCNLYFIKIDNCLIYFPVRCDNDFERFI